MKDLKIYEKIEYIRRQKGVTKKHIAQKCGKTSAWYTGICTGRRGISVEALQQIADALDVDVRIFFTDELSETLKNDKEVI